MVIKERLFDVIIISIIMAALLVMMNHHHQERHQKNDHHRQTEFEDEFHGLILPFLLYSRVAVTASSSSFITVMMQSC